MGWSCSVEADQTVRRWSGACIKSTGSSNVWKESDGRVFMFETSRKEHNDGAITGSIIRLEGWTPTGDCTGIRLGTFRVNGDGTIARAPAFLKGAAEDASNANVSGAVAG